MNGFDQNGRDPTAVGTEGIGKDLIPCQSAMLRADTIFIQALADAFGEGLVGVGDAVDAILDIGR